MPILVLCYEPRSDWLAATLPRGLLLTVMDWAAQKLMTVATDLGVAVVDLVRTFDPDCAAHYGSTAIEPSNVGGQFIADLLTEVILS